MSQLIKGISKVHQTLLIFYSGTAILISFVLTVAGVLPVILTFNLNDSESIKAAFSSYL